MRQRTMKVQVESLDAFEARARRLARRADRGQEIPEGVVISLESASVFLALLTRPRLKLLQAVLKQEKSLSDLQEELGRSRTALRRDIQRLEEAGLLESGLVKPMGHQRRRMVRAVADRVELRAWIG